MCVQIDIIRSLGLVVLLGVISAGGLGFETQAKQFVGFNSRGSRAVARARWGGQGSRDGARAGPAAALEEQEPYTHGF